ncbi:MAG: serine/threonine-protein kinase [Nannocystaceae bacterium]
MDELSPTARRLIDEALAEDVPDDERVQHSWGQLLTGLGAESGGVSTVAAAPVPDEMVDSLRPVARPGERIGRYFVMDVLGRGAMGVVVRAFDPELERTVALKVVNPGFAAQADAEEVRARFVTEARALARLSHPHVVAIYDVGTHGEHVYLAMELVEGTDVAKWLREPRPWPQVVSVFRAVAEGLAAAHEAGLVHRDVKPGNMLLGRDDRVRITDFGIARLSAGPSTAPPTDAESGAEPDSELGPTDDGITQAGFVVGTPAYMAPEQHSGDAVGPAADQFALCVALYEGLYGRRPFRGDPRRVAYDKLHGKVSLPDDTEVPRWLGAVVLRGLRVEPDERFADLRALVAALDDDPSRRRRRWAVRAGALSVVVAGAVGWALAMGGPAACEGTGGGMAQAWNDDMRQQLHEAFVATGRSYAEPTASAVQTRIDEYARAWTTMRQDACEATQVRGEQSEAVLDLRMACLDRRLDEVRALLGVLRHADGEIVDRALTAAAGLSGLDRCADAAALSAEVPPPADEDARLESEGIRGVLAAARADRLAGLYDHGLEAARSARARADALGYAPVQAEARLVEADLVDELGRSPEAIELAKEALWTAQAVGHDEAAAAASVLLVWLLGERGGEPAAGLDWARYAEATLQRSGDDDVLRGRLWLYEGAARTNAGDFDGGQRAYERALAHTRDRLGDEHPSVPAIVQDMANLELLRGHLDAALAGTRDALARLESIYGPEHPRCALAHDSLGTVLRSLGRLTEAEAEHEHALQLLRDSVGPEHPDVAGVMLNLGHVYDQQHRLTDARGLYERALRLLEAHPEHALLPTALSNLGLLYADHGEPERALPHLRRSLQRLEARLGPNNPELAHSLSGLARVHTEQGQTDEALALLQRQHLLVVAAHGETHRMAAIALADMGNALLQADRTVEALERFSASLRAFEGNPDSTPTDLVIALNDIASLLLTLGRLDEALPVLERAAALADDEAVTVAARIDARFNLALGLAARGEDLARAREAGQGALSLLQQLGPEVEQPRAMVEAWLRDLPEG